LFNFPKNELSRYLILFLEISVNGPITSKNLSVDFIKLIIIKKRVNGMLLANAAVGLFQLIISIVFAVIALYLGFAVMSKITNKIDEEKELARGNMAVGIVVGSVFVAIALVVQSGVSGVTVGINKAISAGLFSVDGLLSLSIAVIQLVLGIVLAVGAIYLALNILDRLTENLKEFEEIKKGNVAVALEMAGMIIAVAVIIQSGVIGITAALV
jgi:uncharacterized membrane protein YjfL (UPF0719 family)